MKTLKAMINYSDECLKVILLPALDSTVERAQEMSEPKDVTLISLVDDRMFEPALFFNPHFLLPEADNTDHYIRFLQALRHTDQFALVNITWPSQQSMGLIYPSKNYLMLVHIRPNANLIEPEAPDWAAEAATITAMDVAELRAKLENLNNIKSRALSAETSR
jgi:non-homologous end joining protein Ku